MPADNPWQVLGIPPGSDPESIRKAFRRMALRHHPDLHGGDREAERRFREIADAYRRLSEDPAGPPSPPRPSPPREGLLARIGRGAGAAVAAVGRAFSTDPAAAFPLRITLAEAFAGCVTTFVIERRRDGGAVRSTIHLPVPAGSRDGDRLRFSWRGGEAVATIGPLADPLLTLSGDDLGADVPVPLPLAMAGGNVPVPGLPAPGDLAFGPIDAPAVLYRLRGGGWPRAAGGRGDALYRLWVEHPGAAADDLSDPALYPAHRAYRRILGRRGGDAAVPR